MKTLLGHRNNQPRKQKTVLVVGGAGYIGSHMVKLLAIRGYSVITLDNLSSGHRDAVLGGKFMLGDIADPFMLRHIFSNRNIDAVMHFASFIQVGESMREPAKYYANNVRNTLNLLDAMVAHNVRNLIFSSSAAVYGDPIQVPISESHPKNPINPYGRTKWMVEQILKDYDRAYELRSISLRYFNAAGADPDSQLGERHDPETHLIPLVLQAASGRRSHITVFGHDYDTPDGTCIRDYVHVTDLCEAHLLALNRLLLGGDTGAYNLGNGNGFSVQEIIDTAAHITQKRITATYSHRREGDPARLLADSALSRNILGWSPRYSDIQTIIQHAWEWEKQSAPSTFAFNRRKGMHKTLKGSFFQPNPQTHQHNTLILKP